MSQVVEQILKAASKLPPFPRVAQRVLDLLKDPLVSASQLVEVVQLDPGLTANCLKAVNTAFYGLPRSVDNLGQALTFLGNARFIEVVLNSASLELLRDGQPGYELPQGELWRHSLATALLTQILAQRAKLKPSSALYTAALLHDIGKVALGSFVGDKTAEILKLVEAGSSFLEAERKVLGLDHARLGGKIALDWRFSREMVELIAFHHEPEQRPGSLEVAILYLANLVCQMMGIGGGVDGLAYRGRTAVMELLSLKEKDLERAMADLHEHLVRAESLLEETQVSGG